MDTRRPFRPDQHDIASHTAYRAYRMLYPGVYIERDVEVTAHVKALAAWLWSGGDTVLSGVSAAAVHQAKWLPSEAPAEVVLPRQVRVGDLVGHRDILLPEDVVTVDGMRVTSPVRTAFDLARRRPLNEAVALVDALLRASAFPPEWLAEYAVPRPRHRGRGRALAVAGLVDPGAESPQETRLRLLLVRAGLPRPETQFAVGSYRLDLAWPDFKVAVEYDGAHHFTEHQAKRDVQRDYALRKLGWTVIRVTSGILGNPDDVVRTVGDALRRGGAAA